MRAFLFRVCRSRVCSQKQFAFIVPRVPENGVSNFPFGPSVRIRSARNHSRAQFNCFRYCKNVISINTRDKTLLLVERLVVVYERCRSEMNFHEKIFTNVYKRLHRVVCDSVGLIIAVPSCSALEEETIWRSNGIHFRGRLLRNSKNACTTITADLFIRVSTVRIRSSGIATRSSFSYSVSRRIYRSHYRGKYDFTLYHALLIIIIIIIL